MDAATAGFTALFTGALATTVVVRVGIGATGAGFAVETTGATWAWETALGATATGFGETATGAGAGAAMIGFGA